MLINQVKKNQYEYRKYDKIRNINIRNIQELKIKMQDSSDESFYNAPLTLLDGSKVSRSREFWNIVDVEMIGERNLAAAADLLRYEILRQEGGYYIDTDDLFVDVHLPTPPEKPLASDDEEKDKLLEAEYQEDFDEYKKKTQKFFNRPPQWVEIINSMFDTNINLDAIPKFIKRQLPAQNIPKFSAEKLPFGIRLNVNPCGSTDGIYENVDGFQGNNNFIVSVPDHVVLRDTIDAAIIEYKNASLNANPQKNCLPHQP